MEGMGSPTARGVTGGDISGSDPQKHHQLEHPVLLESPGWCAARVLVSTQTAPCF